MTEPVRIWIDAEDLFEYAAHVRRPSGIQRLAFELQGALAALAPEAVRFVRHGRAGRFTTIPFAAVEALFAGLSGSEASSAAPKPRASPISGPAAPGLVQRGMAALPTRIQEPARRLRSKLSEAALALKDLALAIPAPPGPARALPASNQDFAAAAPGDWLVVLGSPWSVQDYATQIQAQCLCRGLHFAFLVCDIIPIRRPEWCDPALRRAFSSWFHSVAPLADIIFAISHYTARDITHYAQQTGLSLKNPVQPIPLGSGFGAVPEAARTARLPAPGSFVLIVSTIEARKNHLLLFRIWREFSESMPSERIPTLVFAGRAGWLVQDLLQQLDNTGWLDGKIIHIDSPSDAELAALYQDCLFTLFPSFYEGWGLPVTESLAHGAPCLAANRTSLPEAGGSLARYFNPDNLEEAMAAIRAVIESPEDLRAWRAQIAAEYKPAPWAASARAVLDRLMAGI